MQPLLAVHRARATLGGFTLLELLVCLSLLALLSAMAVPSFKAQNASARAQGVAHSLMSAAMLARASAIRSAQPVMLCPAQPNCSGHYESGFGVYRTTGALLRLYAVAEGLKIGNRAGTRPADQVVAWDAMGIGNRNLTWVVCVPGGEPWAVVLNRVGRPKLERGIGRCLGSD